MITRHVKPLALPLWFFFCTSSFSLVHPFVSTGEYERSLALAADCSASFFPALYEEDYIEATQGRRILPGIRLAFAGGELPYLYRLAEREGGVLSYADKDYPWLENLGESRMESLELLETATTTVSYSAPDVECTRLTISLNPAVLQVGIREGAGITTQRKFLDLVNISQDSTMNFPTPGIDPKEHRGEVIIRVYEGGRLVPDADVLVRTDARGVPGRYGRTFGHEHIVRGLSGFEPSIRIEGQRFAGQEVRAFTDGHGEIRLWVEPGYRGGPEAIIARTHSIPTPGARAVVVRHRDMFRHFAEIHGFTSENPPVPSPNFPFVLKGSTDWHVHNHWVQPAIAQTARRAFQEIWTRDPGRMEHGDSIYIALDDMSLEYGGAFKVLQNSDCSNPLLPGHYNHDTGLDFDVAPCYTRGPGREDIVSGAQCASGQGVRIDERTFAALLIGGYGAGIIEEGGSSASTGFHYHVRFPDPMGPFGVEE